MPDAVVCYCDSTVGLPLLASYALARRKARPYRRLYDRRGELMDRLSEAYQAARQFRDERVKAWELPTVNTTD